MALLKFRPSEADCPKYVGEANVLGNMFGWVSVNDRFDGGYILVFGILGRRWSGLSLRIEHKRIPRKKCHQDEDGTCDRSTHELIPPKGGVFLCE